MNQKRTLLTVVMALLFAIDITAQSTMDVAKFTRMDQDLTARVTKPVTDNDEGKLCALIRVITNLKDIEFRADALGIVKTEQHNGEIWIYVPYGARSISFAHDGYFPLLYNYTENIDEGVVYELRLKNYSSAEQATANTNTQMFVLSHNPDDASVFIDGMEVKTENGVFAAMMSKGKHTYKVTADQYEPQEGEIDLQGEVVRRDAKLRPLFGMLELFTLPVQGFNVLVNGKHVGISPYKSGRMEPGKYKVRLEKEKYYPIDTLLTIREGETANITCKLTSFSDSLFYNRQLGGKKVSFGINVGYMTPNISASSGGGFCGSPINYGFGNSNENTNYKSASGFTAGIMADMKIYKNFYLMLGVNYSLYKYKNNSQGIHNDVIIESRQTEVAKGSNKFSFNEEYSMSTIEIPLLASYRFVLSKTGSLHFNAGPFVSYGLTSKMKFSGSAEMEGKLYKVIGTVISDTPHGDFISTRTYNGEFDLFSKSMSYTETLQNSTATGQTLKRERDFDASPFKRFNYGLKLGVCYELRGFQLGVNYNLMLSNMANKDYWESTRIPIMNNMTGENLMSGYKHKISALEIKLGYVLRY